MYKTNIFKNKYKEKKILFKALFEFFFKFCTQKLFI